MLPHKVDSISTASTKLWLIKMTNKVILIRHGRSTGNDDNSFYKHGIDSAVCLTKLGVLQSLNTGEQLKSIMNSYLHWNWQGVLAYTSEYTRAQQTARIVLDKMGLPTVIPTIEPAINERQYGNNDIPSDFHRNPYATCTNGESLVECRNRSSAWWKNYAEPQLSQRDIVLFCHGEVLKCAVGALLDVSYEEMTRLSSSNAVPYIFEKQDNKYVPSVHQFKKLVSDVKEVIH